MLSRRASLSALAGLSCFMTCYAILFVSFTANVEVFEARIPRHTYSKVLAHCSLHTCFSAGCFKRTDRRTAVAIFILFHFIDLLFFLRPRYSIPEG